MRFSTGGGGGGYFSNILMGMNGAYLETIAHFRPNFHTQFSGKSSKLNVINGASYTVSSKPIPVFGLTQYH